MYNGINEKPLSCVAEKKEKTPLQGITEINQLGKALSLRALRVSH